MSHTDTVKKLYGAFQKGDVQTIVDHCSDKVDWTHQELSTKDLPWNGNFSGKKNVPGFFKGLAEATEFFKFDLNHFVEQGDNVAVHLRIGGKNKRNGKSFEHDAVHFWWFDKAGKVAKYRHFNDTAMQRDAWK